MPKTKGFAPRSILARSHPELAEPDVRVVIMPVKGSDDVVMVFLRIRGSGRVRDVWLDSRNALRIRDGGLRVMERLAPVHDRLERTGTRISRREVLRRAKAQLRASERAVRRLRT